MSDFKPYYRELRNDVEPLVHAGRTPPESIVNRNPAELELEILRRTAPETWQMV